MWGNIIREQITVFQLCSVQFRTTGRFSYVRLSPNKSDTGSLFIFILLYSSIPSALRVDEGVGSGIYACEGVNLESRESTEDLCCQ